VHKWNGRRREGVRICIDLAPAGQCLDIAYICYTRPTPLLLFWHFAARRCQIILHCHFDIAICTLSWLRIFFVNRAIGSGDVAWLPEQQKWNGCRTAYLPFWRRMATLSLAVCQFAGQCPEVQYSSKRLVIVKLTTVPSHEMK